MSHWDDRDTRFVYRMRCVIMLLLFILLSGSLGVVAYLSLLGPGFLPLGSYFYLLSYSFGLRLVYLTPDIILATHLLVTPQTVFLVAVFVTSWVLIVTLFSDLHFLRLLTGVEEYEGYGDAKALVKSFTGRGAEGRAGVITCLILSTLVFLFLTAFLLSVVMMYSSEVRSILLVLMNLTLLLYIVEWLTVRKRFANFVQRKLGT